MSNISALQSALSGLLAQRQRLDVIGHNVANVSTPGYSRQRADLVSGGNGPVPALFSNGLITGDGVDVAGISRFRDQFLEDRVIGERAASSQLALQSRYFDRIELVHTEPRSPSALPRSSRPVRPSGSSVSWTTRSAACARPPSARPARWWPG
jgi:flagellar hook-associated protein 1 FlgK